MDFNFPKDKVNEKGIIRNLAHNRTLPIAIEKPEENLLSIDGTDYFFTYINNTGRAKGGNSIILKLYESQKIDISELNYDSPDLILKILKFKKGQRTPHKSEKRFIKEIQALRNCNEKKCQNVIEIVHNGTCKIYSNSKNRYENYLYYTMEYADSDLKKYIETHTNLSLPEKVGLCLSLALGLKELESLNYYHRDLKPDNIFMVGDTWKIGDLGLISERNEYKKLDGDNEFIGPRGWLSPEAMNKFLCENKGFPYHHDCNIDHQSDIFQLGRVFHYIMQFNNPIGNFRQSDFYIRNTNIYQILRTMLNYSKDKRYKTIDDVIRLLKPIDSDFLKLVN